MFAFTAVFRVFGIMAVLGAASFHFTQPPVRSAVTDPRPEIRASPAYAELLLKKTELQAEIEALSADYTDEFPKLAEGRYALELLEKERSRLLAVKPAETARLTLALGKLIIRKVELEVELWTVRKNLQDAHPDVKRAKRKVDVFDAAIREILG